MPDLFWSTCTAAFQAGRQNNQVEAARLVEHAEQLLFQAGHASELLQKRKIYLARLKHYVLSKNASPDSILPIAGDQPDEHLFYPRPINFGQRNKLGIAQDEFTIVATSNGLSIEDSALSSITEAAKVLCNEGQSLHVFFVKNKKTSNTWDKNKHVTTLALKSKEALPDILAAADAVLFIGQPSAINDQKSKARFLEILAMGRPFILQQAQYQPSFEHKKNSYLIGSLEINCLTEAIKTIRNDKKLCEQLGHGAIDYYLKAISPVFPNGTVVDKQLETQASISIKDVNPGGAVKVTSKVSSSPQDNTEEVRKLKNRIQQLETDKNEISERLRSMPSIDPLCISDPSFTWADRKLEDFGIIVFGHTRLDALGAVLESLKRQDALKYTEVWLDGYQGNHQLKLKIQKTIDLVKTYKVKHLHTQAGNYGFRKMLILGLAEMCRKYRDILILEDDCFPTHDSVTEFRKELDLIRENKEIFSVYGHHFKVDAEKEICARFQGWGWATTSEKLMPMLRQLIDCYSMSEENYLRFIRRTCTADVKERIDITPPRQPSYTFEKFFAWDETLCLLTALNHQVHKP
ncbi:MAG: hypothetical protein PHF58_13900, partial [Methylotenera sp.]|nr:hypothetical protein [Methylotenera sp.]